jgi:hypothetical protein
MSVPYKYCNVFILLQCSVVGVKFNLTRSFRFFGPFWTGRTKAFNFGALEKMGMVMLTTFDQPKILIPS